MQLVTREARAVKRRSGHRLRTQCYSCHPLLHWRRWRPSFLKGLLRPLLASDPTRGTKRSPTWIRLCCICGQHVVWSSLGSFCLIQVRNLDRKTGNNFSYDMAVLRSFEKMKHELTHIPFKPWCTSCVKGKAQSEPHKRIECIIEDSELPIETVTTLF